MKKLNKKGFTIVELVIVIAVIAILAGVLIPTFATVVDKANQSKAMQLAKIGYENYLAEYADKVDVNSLNFYIKADGYFFKVNNGQFEAAALKTIDASAKYATFDNSNKEVLETVATTTDDNKTFLKLTAYTTSNKSDGE